MSRTSEETTRWIAPTQELYDCLNDEKFQEAVRLCQELKHEGSIPDPVQTILWEIETKCELHLEHYDKVIQNCKEYKEKSSEESSDPRQRHLCNLLEAYAHYRQQHYAQAIQHATLDKTNPDDPALTHLLAQSKYRMHQYREASDLYKDLLHDDETISNNTQQQQDERGQVLTNALAVALAQATPYVETEALPEVLRHSSEDDRAYDAWINLATYQIITGSDTHGGLSLLNQAEKACAATLQQEGADADEIAAEVAPTKWQARSWSRQWNGQTPEEEDGIKLIPSLPASVQVLQKLNGALAHSSLQDLPPLDPTWTTLQQRLYNYNRAVLQLHDKHYSDCLATCQHLLASRSKQDKKASTTARYYTNDLDEAWWKARVSVVQAHAYVAQQHSDKATRLLQQQLEALHPQSQEQQDSSLTILDRIQAHLQLHLAYLRGRLENSESMLAVLSELPKSLQSTKAVVSTMASLHQELGHPDEATQLLQDAGGAALAEYALARGDYEQAVTLFEESGDRVRLVEALSYVDPARAAKVWETLHLEDQQEEEEELDGAKLEERDLPRRSRKAAAALLQTTAATATTTSTKNKKSHEAILRRRARKREAYLNNLIEQGKYNPDRPTAPDPERWIPKHERSYSRRRRHRGGPAKSHQGGVSEKDAAKLDVAARKAGTVNVTEGPSTAHLGVAGGSKRGGRRR